MTPRMYWQVVPVLEVWKITWNAKIGILGATIMFYFCWREQSQVKSRKVRRSLHPSLAGSSSNSFVQELVYLIGNKSANLVFSLWRKIGCDFDVREFRQGRSRYVFPHDVCATNLKMDGYVLSRKAKVCFGIELTCPMEENIEKWHAAKTEKYREMVTEAKSNG